jgi:prepilin peptidase CpaA
MPALAILIIPDLICLLICCIATVTDLRFYRIPNWLTLGGIVCGLSANTLLFALQPGVSAWVGALHSVVGMLLLLLCFGLLGAMRFVGMGDVKLMAAVGACLRWPDALWALAYVALAGGVLALIYAVGRGQLRAVLTNILRLGAKRIGRPATGADPVALHRIPYALAILIGSTWAAAIKYFPMLDFS